MMNKELMMNDMKVRNEAFDKLMDGTEMMEIFLDYAISVGRDFHMSSTGYMNRKQVMELFDMEEKAVKEYTREDRCSIYSELTDDGMKFFNSSDFNELSKSVINRLCEIIGNTQVKKSDVYEEFKVPNRGAYLFTLKAVHKIGCTIKDSSYRDFVYQALQQKVVLDKQLDKTNHMLLDTLVHDSATTSEFDPMLIYNAVQQLKENSLLTKHSAIISFIEKFKVLIENINNKERELTEIYNEKLKKDITYKNTLAGRMEYGKIRKTNETYQLALEFINEFHIINTNMINYVMEQFEGRADSNLTEILSKLFPMTIGSESNPIKRNKLIKEKKDQLVEMGILEIVPYKSPKGNITNNYLPTEDYKWLDSAKVGKFTNNGQAQSITFSAYGKHVVEYIFNNIVKETKDFTQMDFEDWLIEAYGIDVSKIAL